MCDDRNEVLAHQVVPSVQCVFVNEIDGVDVGNGVAGECGESIIFGTVNIKEIVSERMKGRFLECMIGKFGNQVTIESGVSVPCSLG